MRKHIFTALPALPPAMALLAQYHSENLFSITDDAMFLIDSAVARKRPIDMTLVIETGVSPRTHKRRRRFFYPQMRFFAAFIK